MATNIDFDVCPVDCETFKFTDTTCLRKPNDPYYCTDGYNIPGNINVNDVASTQFNFIFPDGTVYVDRDIQYQVGTKARILIEITGIPTAGFVYIEISGQSLVTTAVTTDVQQSIIGLVTAINNSSTNNGWVAYVNDTNPFQFYIESVNYGLTYNNLQVDFGITPAGMVVNFLGGGVDGDLTDGANGFTNEYCFGMAEILGIECSEQDFPCGVYKMTYRLFDIAPSELGRKTKYILNDNCLRSALKNWILLAQKGECCNEEMDKRIFELRLMHEKAVVQFENCMYDCAQKTIDKALKYMNNICLDC